MGLFDWIFGGRQAGSTDRQPAKTGANINDAKTVKADWEDASGVPQELAASEVLEMYEQPDRPVFLDVREAGELKASGWIPGGVHIPVRQLESRLGELDPAKHVVVYCATGVRSMDAGTFLLGHGFRQVSNLNGGIAAWRGPRDKPE